MKAFKFCLLGGVLAALFGCQSDIYYQNAAVDRAREYLLENAPELNVAEREYVTFNAPVLLYDEQADAAGTGLFYTRQPGQICVSWKIPERKEFYMVVGYSDSRMLDWYPNRLLRREFSDRQNVAATAVKNAQQFVYANLYTNLATSAATEVRFTEPEIFISQFPVEEVLNLTGTPEENQQAIKNAAEKTQFSMLWKWPDSPGKVTVISGYAAPDLKGFTATNGGFYEQAELSNLLPQKFNLPEDK